MSSAHDAPAGKILIVLHQEHSTPARIGRLLHAMGYQLDLRRPALGDDLPTTLEDYAGAAIFGGPMSANDPHDYIRREIDWIGVPLKENKPLLGICLGAQMLARHLGERVAAHRDGCAEIGYYPIEPTQAGRDLAAAPFPDHVYQWHREGFDLPSGATLLATATMFPVQAFSYGPAVALQFHPEVTYVNICRWTTRAGDRMQAPGAQPRHAHMEGWYHYDAPIARWVDSFLRQWIAGGRVALPKQDNTTRKGDVARKDGVDSPSAPRLSD